MMPPIDHYTLDDEGNPTLEEDLTKWALLLDDIERRRVGRTSFSDDTSISTVFFGLNPISTLGHGIGPPLLFETICQYGNVGDRTTRYPTWAAAVAGHERYVTEYLWNFPLVTILSTQIFEKPGGKVRKRKTLWDRLRTGNGL